MKIQNSFDLLCFLKQKGYLKNPSCALWWPNSGEFEVLVGAILVQNTKWEQAFKILQRLKTHHLLSLESLANTPLYSLQSLMQDLGLFRQKSKYIVLLSQNILKDFGDFATFKAEVPREWLLSQKGIGNETCDSILCYGLLREEMVVDAYTFRLLQSLGYTLESYEEIKQWLIDGIVENYDKVCQLYKEEILLSKLYARFHGKIVEYSKENPIKRGKNATKF
ncbi:3-methyladenine DNA glycosylase [Helicobacter mesocricetorum]|uniref:3-methyladenine DNA glycosylase n=1 Tax=Helicobacter mesocricetorum TaxID=87012 RepID=UPI000CF10502|nr:3-methyladenine DNA glycosylase [Helicobacter mesocricetorum]